MACGVRANYAALAWRGVLWQAHAVPCAMPVQTVRAATTRMRRADCSAPMGRGGRDADDRFADFQHPDPVNHQQAHQFEPLERPVRQFMHA